MDLFTNPVLASFESENDLFQFFTDYITMTGICCVYVLYYCIIRRLITTALSGYSPRNHHRRKFDIYFGSIAVLEDDMSVCPLFYFEMQHLFVRKLLLGNLGSFVNDRN